MVNITEDGQYDKPEVTKQISRPRFEFRAQFTDSTTPISPAADTSKWRWAILRTANSEPPIRLHPA